MISVAKKFEFAAAHQLWNPAWSQERNEEVFEKCARRHGHNYTLQVEVAGPVDDETGMVMNVSTLSDLVKSEIIAELDHRDLNTDVPWFKERQPTVENITEYIGMKLMPVIERDHPMLTLRKLTLWETANVYAVREY